MRVHSNKRATQERELKKVYREMDDEFSGCFNCGSWKNATHAHLVPRSRRKDLITDPRNIIHLCYTCHHTLDHGDRTSLNRWPDILERVKELDPEYYELIK